MCGLIFLIEILALVALTPAMTNSQSTRCFLSSKACKSRWMAKAFWFPAPNVCGYSNVQQAGHAETDAPQGERRNRNSFRRLEENA
jgi:hypothetical protein